jgi:hypothetical protein
MEEVELYNCPHCHTEGVLPMVDMSCPHCKQNIKQPLQPNSATNVTSKEEYIWGRIGEVLVISVLSLISYAGGVFIFFNQIVRWEAIEIEPSFAGFIILLFDVGWAILVWKSWLITNKRAKIYLSVLVYALSASILTCFMLATMLKGAFA